MNAAKQAETPSVPGEMHRIDADRNTGVNLQRRDAELYVVLGLFMFALGLPVILGTYFAMQISDYRAAIVNFVCGVVLAGIGLSSMLYGWMIKRRMA
jgi:hypothetical protein